MTDRLWVAALLLGANLFGAALAFAYRGDWMLSAITAVLAMLLAGMRIAALLRAERDRMCGIPGTGRHRRRGYPRELLDVRAVTQPRT